MLNDIGKENKNNNIFERKLKPFESGAKYKK